jgi:hypothetical protein
MFAAIRNFPQGAEMARTKTTSRTSAASSAEATTIRAVAEPIHVHMEPRPRWLTRKQICDLHFERYGVRPSERSVERWSLTWRYANGVAIADYSEVDQLLEQRFNAVPAIRGGRRNTEQRAA